MRDLQQAKIGVIGLGYVGLPLAVEFSRLYSTVGYDISGERVRSLQAGVDATLEVGKAELIAAENLTYTDDAADLDDVDIYVITVPTPVNASKQPDLSPLLAASSLVGGCLKPGNVVIYESTVYPGATEEQCVPILEAASKLEFNSEFFVGYSPERINPGDKRHRLPDIMKVTSGSTEDCREYVDQLYKSIIRAGTHSAPSIRVAEAAKVIENTQRDVNIALINELAQLFGRLGIDTQDVLEASGTKWNFLPFKPGLVGGHCIGVDPYYLTHKAQAVGFNPEMILAGRRINDSMGDYVASRIVKRLAKAGISACGSRILLMGFTFKEDCPDVRNTRVIDLLQALEEYGASVIVVDPWASASEVKREYGVDINESWSGSDEKFDAVVLAVAHSAFFEAKAPHTPADLVREGGIVYDIKGVLPEGSFHERL